MTGIDHCVGRKCRKRTGLADIEKSEKPNSKRIQKTAYRRYNPEAWNKRTGCGLRWSFTLTEEPNLTSHEDVFTRLEGCYLLLSGKRKGGRSLVSWYNWRKRIGSLLHAYSGTHNRYVARNNHCIAVLSTCELSRSFAYVKVYIYFRHKRIDCDELWTLRVMNASILTKESNVKLWLLCLIKEWRFSEANYSVIIIVYSNSLNSSPVRI